METNLLSLRYLEIDNCPEIECFPQGCLPFSLQFLRIHLCKKLLKSPRTLDLPRLPSLMILSIGGIEDESFPSEDSLLPSTFEVLELLGHKNLKMLLQHLTSLEILEITECPLILSLLDGERLPASLTTLNIMKCPLLKPRLDWPKVAHIPCIIVDGSSSLDRDAYTPRLILKVIILLLRLLISRGVLKGEYRKGRIISGDSNPVKPPSQADKSILQLRFSKSAAKEVDQVKPPAQSDG
ncbi:hypothetical protein ACH5RR_028762 [Cinchona calisaya]|uniref:Disease resistance protein n=1 Tax=Cinchona calisaya TaxID=153742 RepID=A0ABD2YPQ3_9GENT